MGEAKRRRVAGTASSDAMAWHYTDLVHLVFIINDGQLEASRLNPHGVGELVMGQRLLWFTTDERGDKTASGSAMQKVHGVPAVRIGMPLESTLPARDGCLTAGWTEARIEEDERLGRRMGADPRRWRVLIADAVPLPQFARVEVQHTGLWRTFDHTRMDVRPFKVVGGSMPDFWRVRGYGLDVFVTPGRGPTGERSWDVRSAEGVSVDALAPSS
jgi:hypothetical protein